MLPHPDAPPGAPFPAPLRLVSRTAFIYPEVPRPNSNTMRSAGSKLRPMTALLLLSAARAAADGPYVSVSGSATWQDNATNATSGDGILESFTLETGVDLSWLHAVDFSTMLTAGAAVAADACTSFSGLDSLAVGPRLELRHRLGLGPLAPALSLALQADGVFFQDSERSNCAAAVAAGYSQRFNDALQLVLDARVGAFDARNDVFSGGYSSLGATLNWDLDETWRLKALLGWLLSSAKSYAAKRRRLRGRVDAPRLQADGPGRVHLHGAPPVCRDLWHALHRVPREGADALLRRGRLTGDRAKHGAGPAVRALRHERI